MAWHSFTFKHEDTARLGAATAGVAVALIGGWLLVSPFFGLALGLVVAFALLFALALHHRREADRDRIAHAEHAQHVQYLHTRLPLRAALAPLTGWSASPRLAGLLYDRVRAEAPGLVVELGSGASSIVMGYALEQNGRGRLLSLEHDAAYAEQTRRAIARHGLTHRVEVVHAPLRTLELAEGRYEWYTFRPEWLRETECIGLVVVDGPPHKTQAQARFPAVPVLAPFFADAVTVVLDDAGRADERAIARRWADGFGLTHAETIEQGKGIVVLERQPLPPAP